ncbi:MAG: amidohydrolase [Clostridia bacterium]|nr:amidohydrolase [Clostridia bacterium]
MQQKDIDAVVALLQDELIAFRRVLHRFPEIGLREVETTERIRQKLLEHGIEPEYIIKDQKIGLTFSVDGAQPGSRIALRADIDALPVSEKTDEPFRSERDGLMHACGHDLNTTIVLGAAIVLNRLRDRLCGSVKFIFQSGEETLVGAKHAIEAGLMDGETDMKYMFAFHVKTDVPLGKIGAKCGNALAASDTLALRVIGKGGHAAHPYKTVDPIIAASAIVSALQDMVAREHHPADPLVLSICTIHGGAAFNVTPSEVEMTGTVRSFNPELRDRLPGMIERVARHTAMAHNADAEVTYTKGVPPLIVQRRMFEDVRKVISNRFGEDRFFEYEAPSLGSEDFAWFSRFAPVMQVSIGSRDDRPETALPLHNERVVFNEDCICAGVRAACAIADETTSRRQ